MIGDKGKATASSDVLRQLMANHPRANALLPGEEPGDSEYYLYSPTQKMRKALYYPVRVGRGFFLKGYRLNRAPLDNFLVAYIREGSFHIKFADVEATAETGDFLIVDCYQPHQFWTDEQCRDVWLHFDGPSARHMYDYIQDRCGNVIHAVDNKRALNELLLMLDVFKRGKPLKEPTLSHHIDGILTELANAPDAGNARFENLTAVQGVLAYVAGHLEADLSLERLASVALLSKYYFAKQFKHCTGVTPHQYVLNARIERAQYLLYSTSLSITEISRSCGFRDVRTFSAAFRRALHRTPIEYRQHMNIAE
ncbi:helix-turn-helix domain-containing protein [Bifidobacterium sp.]|uniref:AraC family transcriptional regulator n=1 Tax=Bifidobacterium sp. TaxID=41200 RepID=UPI0039E86E5D